MERLTYWCPDGKGGGEWRANVRGTEVKGEEVDRLAAYEDTGLEPEKLKKLVDAIKRQEVVFLVEDRCMKGICIKVDGHWSEITVARLQEIMRAERDNRLVVIPYKAEDDDGPLYLTRLQSLSATEKNAFLMGKWGPKEQEKED